MTKITTEEVEHVANLARLTFSEAEKEKLAEQLAKILGYIEQLNELDTENVEPTTHALPIHNVFRQDEAKAGIGVEKILANAPQRDGPFFAVPKVLDE